MNQNERPSTGTALNESELNNGAEGLLPDASCSAFSMFAGLVVASVLEDIPGANLNTWDTENGKYVTLSVGGKDIRHSLFDMFIHDHAVSHATTLAAKLSERKIAAIQELPIRPLESWPHYRLGNRTYQQLVSLFLRRLEDSKWPRENTSPVCSELPALRSA